jgi:hypothetical protein
VAAYSSLSPFLLLIFSAIAAWRANVGGLRSRLGAKHR